jgi:hypothetical protein
MTVNYEQGYEPMTSYSIKNEEIGRKINIKI